jgi:type II secretory ATPase GspE/PulE/Tfp pilus assembly ATPase PilB-like protein
MTLSEKAAFSWPIPPYFQLLSASVETSSDDCIVELLDGSVIAAALEHFDPGESQIHLNPHNQRARQSIALDLVRTIRLTRPLDLVLDAAVVSRINSNETQVGDEGEFLVRFRDGKTFEGMTRGFVKSKSGLFLYLLEGDHQHAWRCFVPQQQLDDVRIGPLLGDELIRAHLVTDAEVATALQKQASLRQRKLGEQLMDHGIVTHEELRRALQSQRNQGGASTKLGDLLLEAELVSFKQLTEALRLQALDRNRRVGDILVDMGAITPWQMQIALSEKLGIPFVNLREFKIDPLVLELVSASFAKRHQVLPLLCMGESLVVAVENPLMMDFAQDLGFFTKKSILPVISNSDDLRASITTEYANHARNAYAMDIAGQAGSAGKTTRSTSSRVTAMEDLTRELGRDALQRDAAAGRNDEFDERVHDNVLVRLVNSIIIEAHAQNASDIHIESNAKANTRVRFRKDGELEDYLELQPAYREALVSRIKVMAGLDVTEHRRAQDGKIDFSRFAALSVELRVAIVPTANNLEDAVLRILAGVEPLPLDQLGMRARDLETLGKMVSHTYGLILVCGPTGSGKTTTLHSLLHTINRPDIKIWTAEDPVEITQAGLRQVQINSRIGWTFATAMRAFLRADPDVIMVGEMRDAETAKIAIEASLTGHLVFSTLHTNTAAESVVRLIELGMDPFNFADALIGILSQRLVRKLCRECKKAHIATEAEILALAREYCMDSNLDPATTIESWKATYATDGHLLLYDAVGCSACRAGFRGRVGVYELMASSPLVKGVIRSRGTAPEVLEAAQTGGMRMLRQDAIEKVLAGAIDLVSARAVWS